MFGWTRGRRQHRDAEPALFWFSSWQNQTRQFFCCHPALYFLLEISLLSGTLGNHLARRDACQGDSSQTHIQESYRSFS